MRALVGPDPLAQARHYTAIGSLIEAVAALREADVSLEPGPLRLVACALAAQAVAYAEASVTPRPGRPRRAPRCDEVIVGMAAVARGSAPASEREHLLALALAADADGGWWETEAVYALVHEDALAALDGTASSLWILVHNLGYPPEAAAPAPIRAALLALLP